MLATFFQDSIPLYIYFFSSMYQVATPISSYAVVREVSILMLLSISSLQHQHFNRHFHALQSFQTYIIFSDISNEQLFAIGLI